MGFGSGMANRWVQPIFAPAGVDCNRKWHCVVWEGKPIRLASHREPGTLDNLWTIGLPLYDLGTERALRLEGASAFEVSTMRSGHLCPSPGTCRAGDQISRAGDAHVRGEDHVVLFAAGIEQLENRSAPPLPIGRWPISSMISREVRL